MIRIFKRRAGPRQSYRTSLTLDGEEYKEIEDSISRAVKDWKTTALSPKEIEAFFTVLIQNMNKKLWAAGYQRRQPPFEFLSKTAGIHNEDKTSYNRIFQVALRDLISAIQYGEFKRYAYFALSSPVENVERFIFASLHREFTAILWEKKEANMRTVLERKKKRFIHYFLGIPLAIVLIVINIVLISWLFHMLITSFANDLDHMSLYKWAEQGDPPDSCST